MMIGQKKLQDTFKRLVKDGSISHSYIFFGDPQVGKYSFAMSLASYLETGSFKQPSAPLSETMALRPGEGGSIGIDEIREMKYFLFSMPVQSDFRVAIIDDADKMTTQAQNAILKIAEEPPRHGLIILVLPHPETLMDTVQSRFQKIYFPRVNPELIVKLLVEKCDMDESKAKKMTALSFGRPGRALQLAMDEEVKTIYKDAAAVLKSRGSKQQVIKDLVENNNKIFPFFTNLIAELADDPIKNYDALRSITERMTVMSRFSTNKRLQLEAALWNI